MIIEYAKHAKKVLKVMIEEITTPDVKLNDFANASENVVTSWSWQALPIELKLYADDTAINAKIPTDGSTACFESEKRATPEGNDSTPAPRIVFARFKIDDVTSDDPVVATAAVALSFAFLFNLCNDEWPWPIPKQRLHETNKNNAIILIYKII